MTPKEYIINVIISASLMLFCMSILIIGYRIPSVIGELKDSMCGHSLSSTTYANGTTIETGNEYYECNQDNYLIDVMVPWLYGAWGNSVLIVFLYAVCSFFYDSYKFLLEYWNWRARRCN